MGVWQGGCEEGLVMVAFRQVEKKCEIKRRIKYYLYLLCKSNFWTVFVSCYFYRYILNCPIGKVIDYDFILFMLYGLPEERCDTLLQRDYGDENYYEYQCGSWTERTGWTEKTVRTYSYIHYLVWFLFISLKSIDIFSVCVVVV